MAGRIVICPTPIGNLEDVTLRVLRVLAEADVIACEDTRHTRILLERHGITTPTVSCHEHNERVRAGELVARAQAGEVIALVSDAGMPTVSDPGRLVLAAALAAQVEVEVLPGPSAPPVALVASGLPGERWCFAGFLPRKAGELRAAFAATVTTVWFESPKRVAATLALLAEVDPARPAAVCRELTKLHEEVVRGTAAELAERFAAAPARGEIVLVVGGAEASAVERGAGIAALGRLVDAGARPRTAAAVVAELTGTRTNELYREFTER